MGLNKRKLKGLIEVLDERNQDGRYSGNDVIGVSTNKGLIETKANLNGVNLLPYKILAPGNFAFVADTSRRGDKMALAYNDTTRTYIVSTWYVVFRVKETASKILSAKWLYLYFNRPEFDRYARANSWGSAREYFWFSDMEDIEIELPPIEVQRKYVAIYEAMLANQRAYEQGLDDLKLICDLKMNDLVQHGIRSKLGNYIVRQDVRNSDNAIKNVKGVSTLKQFREPTSKVDRNNLANYKVVHPGWFSFVQTTHNEKCFAFAYNNGNEDIVVTSVNEVFSINDDELDPYYLSLFFNRLEFDRYARFHSWGSARETFTWSDLVEVDIPYVKIELQKAISDVYRAWMLRKSVNDRLKDQLKDICPILIRGAIEEALKQS